MGFGDVFFGGTRSGARDRRSRSSLGRETFDDTVIGRLVGYIQKLVRITELAKTALNDRVLGVPLL